MKLIKKYKVDYGHCLTLHDGKCRNLHGHTAEIVVTLEGKVDARTGMIMDFGKMQWLEELVNQIDHAVVVDTNNKELSNLIAANNMKAYFVPQQSTAELICVVLADQIKAKMEQLGVLTQGIKLLSLSFAESPDSIVVWEEGKD